MKTDEEYLTELRQIEKQGKLQMTLATWIPGGVAFVIGLYFVWYIGYLRGQVDGTKKCLDDLGLPSKKADVRH